MLNNGASFLYFLDLNPLARTQLLLSKLRRHQAREPLRIPKLVPKLAESGLGSGVTSQLNLDYKYNDGSRREVQKYDDYIRKHLQLLTRAKK